MHRFDGPRAKLFRAKEHLDTLQNELKAFSESNPYETIIEPHGDFFEVQVVFRIRDSKMLLRWSVIVGEALGLVRSALDLIVWQLVLDNGGRPVEGITGLPLSTDESAYDSPGSRSQGVNKIAGVSNDVAAKIRELQPFLARKQGDPIDKHPLWILNELVNRDKHRVLQLMVINAAFVMGSVSGPSPNQIEVIHGKPPLGKLEDGTILSQWKVRGIEDSSDVYVNTQVSARILFDEPTVAAVRNVDALQVIDVHRRDVDAILEVFGGLLQHPIV